MTTGLGPPAPVVTYDLGSRTEGFWHHLVMTEKMTRVVYDHWTTDAVSYEGSWDVLLEVKDGKDLEYVLLDPVTATASIVRIGNGAIRVEVAGSSMESAEKALARLKTDAPPMDSVESQMRPITFWVWTPTGPQPYTRRIKVPRWEEISANYGGTVNSGLRRLVERRFTPEGGQMILWQGIPGTGKTYALRSLLWEWRSWAEFHYIVDPDKFFGEESAYLLSVIFSESQPMSMSISDDLWREDGDDDSRWKVLILEDAGELLSKDARARVGQALSRLLNVVDGIIGQGLKVLIIVTTNEELRELHPAVSRPGRCAAQIKFDPLDPEESSAWLEEHGFEADDRYWTLADLYAKLSEGEGESASDEVAVGFRND